MKKCFLSLFALLNISVMTNAQDITNYRGAFAPAPTRMWTEGWANWDPQNAGYPATSVNVSGNISANTTWTSGNVYLLQGIVYVQNGVTLTIEPGTIIRGDNTVANSSLVVTKGGKIMAEGTQCNPIVFTSNKASGARAQGDWGGIIMLGKATNNQANNALIEGLSSADSRHYHGGTDDNDNSGVLSYVRIEYGGYVFAANNEINGLTMGSVGRLTKIDHVQVSFTNDDSFEWFGGTVNATHLISYRNLDDDFDTDFGWRGYAQYCLGVKDPAIADNPAVSTSEGWESDNDAAGSTLTPKTGGKFYNVTQIGAFRCTSNSLPAVQPTAAGFRRGARIRRNSDLKIFNSILMNNWRGLVMDSGVLTNVDEDSAAFRNNIIAGDFTTTWLAPYAGKSLAAEDAGTRLRLNNINYSNDSVNTCNLLVNAWSYTNPDYRPNTSGAGAVAVSNVRSNPDLITYVDIDNSQFTANQTYDFIVNIYENAGGSTNGAITITVAKPSGWDVTVPSITISGVNQSGVSGSSNVYGGTANENSNWLFRADANNVYITSKPGVIVTANGLASIGLRATRKAGTSAGTNQSLSINIDTNSGGEANDTNNNALVFVGAL